MVAFAVATPVNGWNDCPFPEAADAAKIDDGVVTLRIELDEERRAAVVHVLTSSGDGFADAALICAVRQRVPPGTAGADGKPFRVRFEC